MGSCIPVADCGYSGCYGDEFVDPAWGRPVRRPSNVYYEDELDGSIETDDQTATNGTSTNEADNNGEWVEDNTKCAVVAQNGTIISNCTDNGLSENEFAKEPNVNLVDDLSEAALDEFDSESRFRRHALHPYFQPYGEADYRPQYSRRSRQYIEENDVYDNDDFEDRRVHSRKDFEYDDEKQPIKRAQRSQRKNRGRKGRGKKGRRGNGRKHSKKHAEQHVKPVEDESKAE